MYIHATCFGVNKIWEEEREGNQTSHTNMMRGSQICNKLVVAHHQDRVTRQCLRNLHVRDMLVGAVVTKKLSVILYAYIELCHDTRREFIGREGKRLISWGNDVVVSTQYNRSPKQP